MTDEQMGEIYALGREAFFGGQKEFQVQAYPFRMTALNMARHRNNPNMPFWRMIKQGNDIFETTHQEPTVDVCAKHYVFDGETKGHFDPRRPCPAYKVPDEIASAVSLKQQKDDRDYAALVARNTPTVPFNTGVDGGMNQLFLAKLKAEDTKLNSGSPVFSLMSSQHVPAMGNNVNPPRQIDADTTATTASVAPAPPAAPAAPPRIASADSGESHSMFRSLTGGNWFGHDDTPPPPAQAVAQQPKPRPTLEAKAEAAHHPHPAPHLTAPARPQVAEHKPAPPQAPAATASAAPPAPPAPQAPATQASALLAGAAPVVSATSFNNRWAEVH
jgi:hypothetical protein